MSLGIRNKHVKRFVIDGLPRTGSTALAGILGVCGEVACLVEPFHPERCNGQFHRMATSRFALQRALDLIWLRWDGIKHVWIPPEGWPFFGHPELNDEIVLRADCVVFVRRRNYLQRYVSAMISRRLRFWIGTKEEYRFRLERTGFPEFEVEVVRRALAEDRRAVEQRHDLLRARGASVYNVYYEDLFGDRTLVEDQLKQINEILSFIGCTTVAPDITRSSRWQEIMNPERGKWNSRETYERLPDVWKLEMSVGSEECGWLLQ
jgi:hypothetical protein